MQEQELEITSANTQRASQDPTSLDVLLPVNATSSEKKYIFSNSSSSNSIFSGRYEPTRVCGILLTLDESDLRDLREQLYAALCSAVPAVAGRPLSRRVTGNTAALAEDCWALGFSASQGVLTQRADSSALKSAGRDPLPPPGSIRPAAAVPSDNSDVLSSMETIIATQLRLEREVADLRRDKATVENRLKTVECESARLREECSARDSRIAQLVTLVEKHLARGPVSPLPQQEPAAMVRSEIRVSEPQSRSAENTVRQGASGLPESRSEPDLAAKIAAGIDLRALGGAIATALQWRTGDSDADSTAISSAIPSAWPWSSPRPRADWAFQ